MEISTKQFLLVLCHALLFGVWTASDLQAGSTLPTARSHLAAVETEALKWQPDAVLVSVNTSTADPEGGAYTWAYLYHSPELNQQMAFMVGEDGALNQFPGYGTAFTTTIGDFIDSNQAMAAAVAAGMKTNDYGMTMALKNADRVEWFIPGPDYSYTIDAATGELLSKEE